MVQNYNYLNVLEVFFREPTTIQFIKGVSKKISLAPPSVKNYIEELLQWRLIKKKQSKPFDGYIAHRENDDFLFYKRLYNLYTLKSLTHFLVESYYPKLIVVFGSYALGEDMEQSDIDIFILAKGKKEITVASFEKKLQRKIHLFTADNMDKIDLRLRKKIWNGIVLHGGF